MLSKSKGALKTIFSVGKTIRSLRLLAGSMSLLSTPGVSGRRYDRSFVMGFSPLKRELPGMSVVENDSTAVFCVGDLVSVLLCKKIGLKIDLHRFFELKS
ncbi:hypothetical protein WR25_10801 [Diploscapter pachys]|uniref:Uncharacterized protein n=1 Tax=Diploscapter pachys TaxID=2018661 RepID=A0A2A2JBG7_9BILA|nr:hypothetical protein WR25_10801 [Diploscapter pachys]